MGNFNFFFGLLEILLSIIKAYLTSKKMHNNYIFSLFLGILREGILNIFGIKVLNLVTYYGIG
jgi:hypothetical protein